jgi:hypothetical protein
MGVVSDCCGRPGKSDDLIEAQGLACRNKKLLTQVEGVNAPQVLSKVADQTSIKGGASIPKGSILGNAGIIIDLISLSSFNSIVTLNQQLDASINNESWREGPVSLPFTLNFSTSVFRTRRVA